MSNTNRKVTYVTPKIDKKITEESKRKNVSTSSVIKEILRNHYEKK